MPFDSKKFLERLKKRHKFEPEGKTEWVSIKKKMEVHIDGEYPVDLIDKMRPNEEEKTKKYRKDNYEPVTQGLISQAIDGLYRIFCPENYSIKASKEVTEFMNEPYFRGANFIQWVEKFVMYYMIKDPNGYLVILPLEVPDEQNEIFEPVPLYVDSEKICEVEPESYIIWEEPNTAVVEVGKKKEMKGTTYHVLTDNSYIIFEQYGKLHEYKFREIAIYDHNFGILTAVELKGIWVEKKKVFDSFFRAFLPFANDTIRTYSDTVAVRVTCAYPVREVLAMECNAKDCQDGYIDGIRDDIHKCDVCNGKGTVDFSVYGKYVRYDSGMPKDEIDRPPIRFFSPDVAILAHVESTWQNLMKLAGRALHVIEPEESQSGIAKMYDREREYAMILNISDNVFDNIIYNCLYYFELYLKNGYKPEKPLVVKPSGEFAVKTALNILEELSILSEKEVSEYTIKETTLEYINKKYASNPVLRKIHTFLLWYDVLYCKKFAEKSWLYNVGLIDVKTMNINLYGFTAIYSVVINQGFDVLDKGFEYLINEVDKVIKKLAPAVVANPYETDPNKDSQNA